MPSSTRKFQPEMRTGSVEGSEADVFIKSLDRVFAREGLDACRVAAVLINTNRKNTSKLAYTLRSHLVDPVTAKETETRADLDRLLSYYSYIELAYLANFRGIEKSLDTATMKEVLNVPAVRRYYEHLYPLALPSALRLRLDGTPVAMPRRVAVRGSSSTPVAGPVLVNQGADLLSGLISLHYTLQDRDVEVFLDLLDDYHYEGVDLQEVLYTLNDPESFVKRMFDARKRAKPLSLGARGLVQFLQFSQSFEDLLRNQRNDFMRSAAWHLHAYWFELSGGVVYGALSSLIERFAEWTREVGTRMPDGVSQENVEATLHSMNAGMLALRRLCSSAYRHQFESTYLDALERELVKESPRRRRPAPPRARLRV